MIHAAIYSAAKTLLFLMVEEDSMTEAAVRLRISLRDWLKSNKDRDTDIHKK